MYTDTGINHVNRYLAGRTTNLATHIVMGLDKLNTTGDLAPLVSDRHPSAWEAVRAPIVSSSTVDEFIIYTTSHDSVKVGEFLGNNMSLVYYDDDAASTSRIRKHLYFDFENGWTGQTALTAGNTPVAWFNELGGMLLSSGDMATLEGSLGLGGYSGNDIISIPAFFTTAAPTGGVLEMTFTFKVGGVDTTYTINDMAQTYDGGTHFRFINGVPSVNDNGAELTTTLYNPQATVWQMRLNSGTTPTDFLNNLSSIWRVELSWTDINGSSIYVGAPQITPDFDADTSSIVVSNGDLDAQVINSSEERISIEYRIIGLSKP